MLQKTITLYTVDELKEKDAKAYTKAYESWKAGNDYMFMEDCLNERLHELLEEKGIKDTNDTSKAGTKPTRVMYSLGYCQGDGAIFEGEFIFKHEGKEYTAKVKQSGRYYHYNSKDITIFDSEGEDTNAGGYTWSDAEEYFNGIYVEVCRELETYGYDFMEHEDSEENFNESCDANGYTFREDGTMENA